MKSYTDLKQSKKLAEILPVESADMFYRDSNSDDVKLMWEHVAPKVTTPCWSLAALLDILPKTIEDKWSEYDLEINMIYKKPEYIRICDCHHSDFPSWDWDNEELLDNIVEAVIWLNNNGYLRHEIIY